MVLVLIRCLTHATFRVHHSFLLLQSLLLEEQADVVDGEDDALAIGLLGIDVHAPHENRVGTVEQRQEEYRDAVG